MSLLYKAVQEDVKVECLLWECEECIISNLFLPPSLHWAIFSVLLWKKTPHNSKRFKNSHEERTNMFCNKHFLFLNFFKNVFHIQWIYNLHSYSNLQLYVTSTGSPPEERQTVVSWRTPNSSSQLAPTRTIGQGINCFPRGIQRGQTGGFGLRGSPALQGSQQWGGPVGHHPQGLPFKYIHLVSFRLWLIWVRLLH